jgi:hypothetical protein
MGRAKLMVAGAVLALAVTGCAGPGSEETAGFTDPVGRGFPIVTPPASVAAPPSSASASPSASVPAKAITKMSACRAKGTVRLTATFLPGYEYRHVLLDADGDPATGYDVSGRFGADYMIENEVFYESAGRDWSWTELPGVAPLVSQSAGTSRWRIKASYVGDSVVFNLTRSTGAEVDSPLVPVKDC